MPTISGITKDASGTPCEALVVAYRRSDIAPTENAKIFDYVTPV